MTMPVSTLIRIPMSRAHPQLITIVQISKLALLALLLTAVTAAPAALIESARRTSNLAIPDDGGLTGVGSTLSFTSAIYGSVPNAFLAKVTVELEITNGYNGDLYAFLDHGTNRAILLNRTGRTVNQVAGYGDAGFRITLDDSAPNGDIHFYRSVTIPQSGPLTGVWQPDGRDVDPELSNENVPRTALLNVFTANNPNGEWRLAVFDAATGERATLVSWGVVFTYSTPAEIVVHNGASTNAAEMVSGQPTPVDFGTTGLDLPRAREFTLANTGLTPLILSNVVVPSGYLVLDLPTLPFALGPQSAETLTLILQAAAGGTKAGNVQILSSDADEGTFTFPVTGVVDAEPPVIVTCATNRTLVAQYSGMALLGNLTGEIVATDNLPGALQVTQSPFPGTPLSPGNRQVAFTVTDAAGNKSVCTANLFIPVPTPEIVVQQPAGVDLVAGTANISFGSVSVGVSDAARTFIISNSGNAALTGLAITTDGLHPGDFTVGTLGATTLAPSASTSFTVRFTPAASGVRHAALHIANSDADKNPFDITLIGTGTAPDIAVQQPAGVNLVDGTAIIGFGSVSVGFSSAAQTFIITNRGNANLSGLAITTDGSHPGDFTVVTFGATTLAPGASTNFTVIFTPAASGVRGVALHITNNDADKNPFDILLTGTGMAAEIVVQQPAGIDLVDGTATVSFGSVSVGFSSAEQTFTISNSGNTALSVPAITTDGLHPGDFTVGTLGATTLAPGASTTFTVAFQPSEGGLRSAVLHIANNDADENPFDIILTGTGLNNAAATLTVSGGNVLLTFAGIPGYFYQVQRSSDLITWTPLATLVAQSNGLFIYPDISPPWPAGYYRAIPTP